MQGRIVSNFRLILFIFFSGFILVSCGGGDGGGKLPDTAAPDTIPPVISLIKPTPGLPSVQINDPIEIEFNENIKIADTNNILIRLYDSNNNVEYAGSVVELIAPDDFILDGKKLRVNPGTLQNDSKYQVIVKDFVDTAGNIMLTQCQWDFATGNYLGTIEPLSSKNCGFGQNTPDVTAPKILSVTPTGLVVANTTIISIAFSEAIDQSTLNSNITISKVVNDIPEPIGTYDYSYNNSDNTLTLIPNTAIPLELDSRYQVKIETGLLDTSGNALESVSLTFFKTFADIAEDITPPLAVISPMENSTVNPNSDIIVRFSEGMNESSILANIKLSQITTGVSGDVAVSVNLANIYSYTYNNIRNEAVFSVISGQSLAFNSKYFIEILTGVTDVIGNPLAAVKSSVFSTTAQPDITPPEVLVSSVFPANAATVEPTINIAIPFSEPMNLSTLQSNIDLSIISGTSVTPVTILSDNYSFTYNETTKTVTYTQSLALGYATTYRIMVKGGTGGVQDLNGNELVADFVSDFTTTPTPDLTPPLIDSVVPADGSIIAINKNIVITFNEPMNPQTFKNNFELYEVVAGTPILMTFPYTLKSNSTLTIVTLTAAMPALLPARKYQLVVKGNASGVKDTAGISLVADFVTKFSTASASNQWTWMDGKVNAWIPPSGVYSGVNTYPGSKTDVVSWTDANGHLWIFGGRVNTNFLNELWSFDGSSWVYESAKNATSTTGQPKVNAPGVYSAQTGIASRSIYPGARWGSATWVDAAGNLWLFGGRGFDSNGVYDSLNDLWKYTPTTTKWTWVSGKTTGGDSGVYSIQTGIASATNLPPARDNMSYWTGNQGNLWLFSGGISNGRIFSDVWKYTIATDIWTWEAGSKLTNQAGVYTGVSPSPGPRNWAAHWKDSAGNFMLFGGHGLDKNGGSGVLNDLWNFTPSTGKWTFISGSQTFNPLGVFGTKLLPAKTNMPGGFSQTSFWTDSKNNFWVWGTFTHDINGTRSPLIVLWRYDGISWTWMHGENMENQPGNAGIKGESTATTIPYYRRGSVSWTDSSDNLWMFGGSINNKQNNEFWKYTP